MLRLGTRLCVVSSALLVAAGICVLPANAASTRAEYIGQVDPICQAFVGPVNDGFSAYNRNYKRMVRAAKSGTVKAFLRQTTRTARSLSALAQVHATMIGQIAAVPPAAADAATIGAWLGYLRQEEAAERTAAWALASLKFRQYFRKLRQADQALRSGQVAISGFGFQVCGIAVY